MANGYFERGEMYDILIGSDLPGEMASHRPGIIVSSDVGNRTNSTVILVFTTTTTTTNRRIGVNHFFTMSGIDNYALCNQFVVVNKTRLKKFHGKLSDSDMREIDKCIENALDLGYVDDTPVKEKEKEIAILKLKMSEQSAEMEKLNAQVAAHNDETASLKIENEMWKRLYEKVLDQLCSMKLNNDINRRDLEVPHTQTTVEVKKTPEEKTELTDINSAGFNELKACGFTDNVILQIIQKRPHKKVEDLQKLAGLTSAGYQILSKKVCCIVTTTPNVTSAVNEPKLNVEKVNINTAGWREIKEKTGIGACAAQSITGYRRKHGLYKSVEELRDIPYMGPKQFEKYSPMFEV